MAATMLERLAQITLLTCCWEHIKDDEKNMASGKRFRDYVFGRWDSVVTAACSVLNMRFLQLRLTNFKPATFRDPPLLLANQLRWRVNSPGFKRYNFIITDSVL